MKKLLIAAACLSMGIASYADTIDLTASADTAVWYRTGNASYNSYVAGADVDMDTYHFGTGLNSYLYVKFDMSSLGNITINSATFTLTKTATNTSQGLTGSDRNDTLVTGRIDLFGLNNVAGNTAQNWDESTFSFDATGNELTEASIAAATGAPFLNSASFAGLESVSGGTVVSLTGAEITSFLQGRADDDGYVTFMAANPDSTDNRGIGYITKEQGTGAPVLSLDYTVIPEPATLGLVCVFGVGALFIRRRLSM